jgi:hypothetical protein
MGGGQRQGQGDKQILKPSPHPLEGWYAGIDYPPSAAGRGRGGDSGEAGRG